MFEIADDMTIYITRGDVAFFSVTAGNNGTGHKFQPGDVVRMKVYAKKDASNVAFQKDFPVLNETDVVEILLTEEETKIGDIISKPVDYWYEVELNPYSNPQTIIGYDDDGPKIFKLFPEGRDLGTTIEKEELPVVDKELSLTSDRPVENQAITRAMTKLSEDVKSVSESGSSAIATMTKKVDDAVNKASKDTQRLDTEIAVERARINGIVALKEGSTTGDAELMDIRTGADGTVYDSAGDAVRGQVGDLKSDLIDFLNANKIFTLSVDDFIYGTTNGTGIEEMKQNLVHKDIHIATEDMIFKTKNPSTNVASAFYSDMDGTRPEDLKDKWTDWGTEIFIPKGSLYRILIRKDTGLTIEESEFGACVNNVYFILVSKSDDTHNLFAYAPYEFENESDTVITCAKSISIKSGVVNFCAKGKTDNIKTLIAVRNSNGEYIYNSYADYGWLDKVSVSKTLEEGVYDVDVQMYIENGKGRYNIGYMCSTLLDVRVGYTEPSYIEENDFSEYFLKSHIDKGDLYRTLIMAHKGGAYLLDGKTFAENTLEGIKKCVELGFDCIEVDVQETKDGVFVLYHNEYLEDMTTGTGLPKNVTYDYIANNVVYTKPEAVIGKNIRLATLEDFLCICKVYGIIPYLDVKGYGINSVENLLALLEKYNMLDTAIVEYYEVSDNGTESPITAKEFRLHTPTNLKMFANKYGNPYTILHNCYLGYSYGNDEVTKIALEGAKLLNTLPTHGTDDVATAIQYVKDGHGIVMTESITKEDLF